jgi:isopenicillin-N N-acyltransferase-like protein
MTTPHTIPLLQVAGSHREVGAQIAETCADTILEAVAFPDADIPQGRSRADQLELAVKFREITAPAYPWYIEELEGAAEAVGVDPLALFACMIEEIWYEPHGRKLQGRCTDMVAVAPATADGRVLVAHNNDMPRAYQDQLVAIEWRIPDDPVVLSIGNGIWMSAGWNSAGLSFTGNELAPLDERVGIPREIQFRSMLRQPTMGMAVGEALRHDRASSYNNVIVSRDEVVNVEGSATDAELTDPDERGHLVHTNHYVWERMQRYEGDPDYVPHSDARYRRAAELLATSAPGSVTVDVLRTFLSDHEGAPTSICRHPEMYPDAANRSATAFWCIADVGEMNVTFGRGNPCDSVAQEYAFSAA